MKKPWDILAVIIAAAGLIFAYRNDFFMKKEFGNHQVKRMCVKFVEYGQSGTLSEHLNIFTETVKYYGAGWIDRNEIKKHYFPASRSTESIVRIQNDDILIDESEKIATFTIVHEKFSNGELLSKRTEVTEIHFVYERNIPKINQIIQRRVRSSNFQDSNLRNNNTPDSFDDELNFNESYRVAGQICIVNGGRINVRVSPSLRSRIVKSNYNNRFSAYRNEEVELISRVKVSRSIEGIHIDDRYGFILLNKGRRYSKIYIVASGQHATIPNNEIETIEDWAKIRLRNGEEGYVVSSLITCQ